MAELHEVLAVEGDRQGNAKRVSAEARHTFENKPNLFTGSLKSTRMFAEDAATVPDEHIAMVSTVAEKLKYVAESVGGYYDIVFQKDSANQNAVSDVIVDGQVFISAAPVTWLLGMETKLRDLRQTFESIPTLQAGTHWEEDPGHEKEGVFRSKFPKENFKTKKEVLHKVLYEATGQHPAQIEKWNEMVNVGLSTENIWSGMISPAQKSAMLFRIDNMIQGFKKARQRANGEHVEPTNVGQTIFNYILG